ncbi:MAG: SDR family oxidoreductase [Spirochaetales bacterium]|nr:SDR family oxidoreductase [Spirochaetales bacterium]
MFELKGKKAIVTGAGSKNGIGRATALALAQQGADVAVCDINEAGVKATAEEIKQLGRRSLAVVVDVTSPDSVINAVQKVLKEWGKVDILANIAGITQPIKVINTTPEDFDRILAVNLKGTFLFSKAVLPAMMKQKAGRIINMSSVSGKRGGGVFGGAHYSAAKAGVLGFAKALAREVAPYNITVNSIAPGLVLTDIRGGVEPETEQARMAQDIPLGRLCKAEEVAAAICFLASEEAGYITGEEIDINGGSHMD